MYTLDEINAILSDLDACGRFGCADCSRSGPRLVKSLSRCLALDADAAALIRWLLAELNRHAGEPMQMSGSIVHCADCRFAEARKIVNDKTDTYCRLYIAGMNGSDFCSKGKAREEVDANA